MPHHRTLFHLHILMIAALLSACGKSTVKPGHTDPGFSLENLREGRTALIVDGNVRLAGFEAAFASRFGTGDSLATYLSARILDSLNSGNPAITALAAPAMNPRHIIHVRNIVVDQHTREIPTAVLPSGGPSRMEPAGGGSSKSCVVTLDVEVWETAAEGTQPPDSASGFRRLSFTVTGQADVPLFAYKAALVEAVNAAARRTAWHLRGE
jgi:hypothetical protein